MKRIRSIGILFGLLLLVLTVGGTSVLGDPPYSDIEEAVCTSTYTERAIPPYLCPNGDRCRIACVIEDCETIAGVPISQTIDCWITFPDS